MDNRDIANRYGSDSWYDSFDESTMKITLLDDTEIPAEYVVCNICEGKGKHVNPNIDAHGITQDEFDDDPEFRENYFAGVYDVTCYGCGGKRVVPVVSQHATKEQRQAAEAAQDDLASYIQECEAERRYGA